MKLRFGSLRESELEIQQRGYYEKFLQDIFLQRL